MLLPLAPSLNTNLAFVRFACVWLYVVTVTGTSNMNALFDNSPDMYTVLPALTLEVVVPSSLKYVLYESSVTIISPTSSFDNCIDS